MSRITEPKLPKNWRTTVSFDWLEGNQIKKAAKRLSLSKATWIRMVVVRELKKEIE